MARVPASDTYSELPEWALLMAWDPTLGKHIPWVTCSARVFWFERLCSKATPVAQGTASIVG
jgi:hypothetical protein